MRWLWIILGICVGSVSASVLAPACRGADSGQAGATVKVKVKASVTLVEAAREQVGRTVRYDPAYRALAYPGGDVPADAGVCTDVVIRAMRRAWGMDLQKLVHEDMRANFAAYPANWGLRKPDRNIDHRRVPNLQTYFRRRGYGLPVTREARDYRAGDVVACVVPPNLPHIMVVSDRREASGRPLVIHNIGAGAREEDSLFAFRITGHYRVPAPTGGPSEAVRTGVR